MVQLIDVALFLPSLLARAAREELIVHLPVVPAPRQGVVPKWPAFLGLGQEVVSLAPSSVWGVGEETSHLQAYSCRNLRDIAVNHSQLEVNNSGYSQMVTAKSHHRTAHRRCSSTSLREGGGC